MGRTQNERRLFILRPQPCHVSRMVAWFLGFFKRHIFFSFDPNQSDASQGEKDSRPGSHDDSNDLLMDLPPYLSFHQVRETAMEADRGNSDLVITDRI